MQLCCSDLEVWVWGNNWERSLGKAEFYFGGCGTAGSSSGDSPVDNQLHASTAHVRFILCGSPQSLGPCLMHNGHSTDGMGREGEGREEGIIELYSSEE